MTDHLSQLLSQLDVGGEGEGEGEGEGDGEEGEEQLMRVMEGMMDTLLSRDLLYPSLTEICKQVGGAGGWGLWELVQVCTHTHTHARAHTHTHTHMYAHTHTPQYPGWLAAHKGQLSSDEFSRYSKQLEIMRAICHEFEEEEKEEREGGDSGGGGGGAKGGGAGGGGGGGGGGRRERSKKSAHFDRILYLMQQVWS